MTRLSLHIGLVLPLALALALPVGASEIAPRLVEAPPLDAHRHRLDQLRARVLSRLGEPGAAADLYELRDLLEEGGSLERAADLLYRVAESWRTHPQVRALARRLLADVERRRGRLPRMQANLAAIGVITDVSAIGPFPNENGAGFSERYGPELEGDLQMEHEGQRHPVRWRALPGLGRTGTIVLDEAFRGGGEQVVYVLAEIRAPRALQAQLFLGTPGPTRAWLSGRAILSDPDDHPARFDQRVVPISLRPGPNHLLLKIASRGTFPLLLEMRVADEKGAAIPGLRVVAPTRGAYPPAERIPEGRVMRGRSPLVEELAQRGGPRGLEDWARVLGERHPFDRVEKKHVAAVERAASAAPGRPEVQLLAARWHEEDLDRRRAYLERAVAAERSGEALAHAALARHWLSRGSPWKAIEVLAPRLPRAQGDWVAHEVWARAWEAVGERARARRIVEELVERYPDEGRLHRRLAQHARRDGQVDEAIRRLRVALGLQPADRAAALFLATSLVEAGRVQEADEVLVSLARLLPVDLSLAAWRAELLAANGRLDEARAVFREVLAVAPDEARTWEKLGRLEIAWGDAEAAREAFSTALRLAPQNAELREKVRTLGWKEDAFADSYLRDLREEAARIGAEPPEEDAVRLAEVRVVRVHPSGQASRTEQSIVWVGSQRGADRFRTFHIRYAPDREVLRIERARILRPDGSIEWGHVSTERSLHDTEAGIYYDARLRLISFPNLRPGDVVELVYRLDDIARDNLLSDYFGDIQLAQDTVPIASWEYVLHMPPGRAIHFNDLPGARYERAEREDGVLHRWLVRDSPKIVVEPRMPGWIEVARYLHVSTFASWDEVARYWWGLVEDQVRPTEEIREQAQRIVAGIPAWDVQRRVEAIHRYVVEKTRYVGLELGIHSYKPYRADQVLRRGFGDCKDKAGLTYALLRAVGIDARLVLLRMRNLGRVEGEPASLAVFNHAVLYVPALDLFLDGTAEWSGATELPEADRDAEILVVHPDGRGERTRTGVGRAEENVRESRLALVVREDGSAAGEGEIAARGVAAPALRRVYASPNRRKQALERRWAQTHPGLTADEVETSDPRALDRSFTVRFSAEIPSLAEPTAAGARAIYPLGRQSRLLYAYAPLGRRDHDLVLPPPGRELSTVEIVLPDGAEILEIPPSEELKSRFGVFRLRVAQEGGRLVVHREFELSTGRVSPEDYTDFRDFLRRVDALASPRIVYREPAVPPSN